MTSSAAPQTAASSETGLLDLETELTCSICTDLLFQPLTLLDCLHTFCGSCLKEWFAWQAAAARQKRRESARSPPSSQTIYTCPSCRAGVRETRPNATVTTLLDMYSRANPSKGRSEEEKKEIAKHYKVGESVLPPPPSPLPERSGPSRRDAETEAEQDRLLVDEVRRASLRELEERGTRSNRGERESDRDARNRRRDVMLSPNSRPSERATARETRRDRTDRSPRPSEDQQSSSRSLEHQSSLRSLISSSDLESQEMEEEIMRQIMDEGLLDGINLSNINRQEEDEISERIAQAYRRRQRDRARGTESATTRTNGRARETERSEAPPSSYHLDRAAHTPRSGPRSSSQGSNSSSRVRNQARSSGDDVTRIGVRSSSETSSRPDANNVIDRGHRRMLSNDRRSTDPERLRTSEDSRNTASTAIPAVNNVTPSNTADQLASTSTEVNSTSETTGQRPMEEQSQQIAAPQPGWPVVATPFLYCSSCAKPRIQHDLHYVCTKCTPTTGSSDFALCLTCYRTGKGCQHWYGFGRNASNRYNQLKAQNHSLPPPHILTPEKYVLQVSEAENEESTSSYHLTGVFCDICSENANDCYWRCATCNDGEWGYCNRCVNQARHCTHSLLPLFWNSSEEGVQSSQRSESSSSQIQSPDPIQLTALPIHTTCNSCSNPIPPSTTRHHCPSCNNGDYDICSSCYASSISTNKISRENGLQGWRKCETGHRMLLIGFESRPEGQKRIVVESVVGGWQMRDEDADLRLTSTGTDHENISSNNTANPSSEAQWSWRDSSSGAWKTTRHAAAPPPQQQLRTEFSFNRSPSFPPAGGHGAKMTVLWTRIPDEGVEDELIFPRGAQITEVLNINEDWCWGVYCGRGGLFPKAFGRVDR